MATEWVEICLCQDSLKPIATGLLSARLLSVIVPLQDLTHHRPACTVFDWLLTFPREVSLFWTGNSGALPTTLYFVHRYMSMLAGLSQSLPVGPMSTNVSFYFPQPEITETISGLNRGISRVFLP